MYLLIKSPMIHFPPEQIRSYLEQCIELALEARSDRRMHRPYIGAMLVDGQGKIISTGRKHLAPGLKRFSVHAEHQAIDNGIYDLDQKTVLITTLEPCTRKDLRRQSCSELIVKSGIKQVIFGAYDDSQSCHPHNGERYLQNEGVETVYFKELNERIARELMDKKYMDHFLSRKQNQNKALG